MLFVEASSDQKPKLCPSPDLELAGTALRMTLGALLFLLSCSVALSQDNGDDGDDGKAQATPQFPTTYLDIRTNYNTLPAGSLSIGFGGPSALATHLSLLSTSSLSSLTSLTSPSSQSIGVDVPLTVDLSDRVSVYGGFTAQNITTPWTSLAVSSWNVGFQADVYQQNGGYIPTITVQPTVTRSVPDSPLATTSFNILAEADYALNKDETRGLLAGCSTPGSLSIRRLRASIRTSSVMSAPTINGTTIGSSAAAPAFSHLRARKS